MIGTNNGSKYVARYFVKVFMPGLQL